MGMVTYAEVLDVAQQLPPDAQVALAETLLQNVRIEGISKAASGDDQELVPLAGLNGDELRALADAVVAADHQQRVQRLLEKNRQGLLAPDEQSELDHLLAEADQVALLKARALYTMKIFGVQSAIELQENDKQDQ